MSGSGSEAVQFFTILTRVRERALEFERALWGRDDHRRVREHHWLCPAYYLNGPTYQEYVVLSTSERVSVTWCLELGWRADEWLIECYVVRDDDDGQTMLKEFPERHVADFSELERQLSEAMDELFSFDVPTPPASPIP